MTTSFAPLKRKEKKASLSSQKAKATPRQDSEAVSISPGRNQGHISGEERNDQHLQLESRDGQDTADESRIQILDLHTANPIVSYQNHVYSCSWASNIGTELLFTAVTGQQRLPALISKPDYSVLAATALRLLSKPAQLLHKQELQAAQQLNSSAVAVNELEDIEDRIPVGPGARSVRVNQARFLEQLIKVKRERGEKDEVTVYAIKRHSTGTGWRVQETLRKRQQAEELRQGAESSGQAVETASGNLEGMEQQAREIAQLETVCSEKPARNIGRPRGGGRGSQPRGQKRGTERLFKSSEGVQSST